MISSTEALALTEVPGHLAVVGGGYIGLELGMAYAMLGSKVTVVEAQPRVLPLYDDALVRPVEQSLRAHGVEVLVEMTAERLDGERFVVNGVAGASEIAPVDYVLVTVGRVPATTGWGLNELDLTMDGRFIKVDERCRTSMRGVYAVGDVTGEPMLALRAIAQGEMVAQILADRPNTWDRVSIPSVVYTSPEIVSVGLLPRDARERGIETVEGVFPFRANGRAMTAGDEAGFVRVVARADDHVVLGLQAVGADVSELSSQFALALRWEPGLRTCGRRSTPTRPVPEAALRAVGRALHI